MNDTAPAAAESTNIPPVTDFATDWDFNDPRWVDDPFPIWADLRARCLRSARPWPLGPLVVVEIHQPWKRKSSVPSRCDGVTT